MKIAGIIAEYNPFHTGHAYHIAQTRKLTGADGVAVIMSGNFVQRGGPAVADKWVRARAAVAGGADVVFELPVCFAHAPAQIFATGAVQSFEKSGCINALSFGVEEERFLEFAEKIISAEACIEEELKSMLTEQIPYPVAYAAAVNKVCDIPEAFLTTPNNMLALEYVKALAKMKSTIKPYAVLRAGAGYHEHTEREGYVSATAMRSFMEVGDDAWLQYMPQLAANIYKEAKEKNRFPVTENQFDAALLSVLRRMPAEAFADIADMPQGFENRIVQMARQATSIEELCALCNTKQYTSARVRRLIWNCFLDVHCVDDAAEPEYLRVLAFNEKGRAILKKMKETCSIPLVIKAADALQNSSFLTDVRATDLYFAAALQAENRRGGRDYRSAPEQL